MTGSPAQPSSSSKPPTSSRKRQLRPTSSGRPTSPISRSSAGAGTTSPRSSMITHVTSSLGSCARRCAPTMSPTRLNWRWRLQLRQCQGRAQTTTAQRQRIELHLGRSCRMAKGSWHGACSRRPVPSTDPGQDRALAPNAQVRQVLRQRLPLAARRKHAEEPRADDRAALGRRDHRLPIRHRSDRSDSRPWRTAARWCSGFHISAPPVDETGCWSPEESECFSIRF